MANEDGRSKGGEGPGVGARSPRNVSSASLRHSSSKIIKKRGVDFVKGDSASSLGKLVPNRCLIVMLRDRVTSLGDVLLHRFFQIILFPERGERITYARRSLSLVYLSDESNPILGRSIHFEDSGLLMQMARRE